MQLLFIRYGLLAVFLAAALEADIVPVLTGVVAHAGYVNPGLALLAASAGAFSGDCAWFCVGRRYSKRIKIRVDYRRAGRMAEDLINVLGIWGIPASHVVYGTRVATMIFWGARRFSIAKFALVDALGCVGLTSLLFMLGFWFSAGASQIVGGVKRVELLMLFAVIITVLVFQLTRVPLRRALQRLRTGEGIAKGR